MILTDSGALSFVAAHAHELVQHQQGSAAADGDVGNIEGRKVGLIPVEQQKIYHVPVHQAIHHVADGTAQNQAKRQAKQGLFGRAAQHGHDKYRGNGCDADKEPALPTLTTGQKAERRAGVVEQGEIKKGQDIPTFLIEQVAVEILFGPLVQADNKGGQTNPGPELPRGQSGLAGRRGHVLIRHGDALRLRQTDCPRNDHTGWGARRSGLRQGGGASNARTWPVR